MRCLSLYEAGLRPLSTSKDTPFSPIQLRQLALQSRSNAASLAREIGTDPYSAYTTISTGQLAIPSGSWFLRLLAVILVFPEMAYPLQATRSLVVAIVFTFLATLTVGLRLVARRQKRVELGYDDLMIVLGLIFTYPVMILLILGKFDRPRE